MGAQRVLQAAVLVAFACTNAFAAPKLHERVAVIDLGPDDGGELRRQLLAISVDAGFDVVIGDGIEDALAGIAVDQDTIALATSLAEAQRAFGALDCAAAIKASEQAIAIGAMRQAAALAVPELSRALTYTLLCRDKAGDVDGAMMAASRLRAVGGSADVPAAIWNKYPDVDTLLDHELLPLRIDTDVKGAIVFVDLRPAGKAPLDLQLRAGEHLIAVAAGTRRGWASGHTDPKQKQLVVATSERGGAASPIAARVAAMSRPRPSAADIAFVMNEVRARVVLIRSGDKVEAWGRAGRAEAPRLLGGDDGIAKVHDKQDTRRMLALVADRVQTWNDRAPDPDQPLLVEKPGEGRRDRKDEPTRWWVYAALAGAVLGAAGVIYVNDAGVDRQRVELTVP